MSQRWQYRRSWASVDLAVLGVVGWELVAVDREEWIFKRPEPSSEERFTLDQREIALSGGGAAPVTRHLLNPAVASLIRRVIHTQSLLLADRGFPVPPGLETIDLSLTSDVPTILQVLDAVLPDLPADRLIVAEEMRQASTSRWEHHQKGPIRVESVPHLELKRLAREAVGCIRTGDSVPYANLLIVGG